MSTIDPKRSLLLFIDFQARLMPAIEDSETVILNAGRLLEAARILEIPRLFTEQNPKGLGSTVDQLPVDGASVFPKKSFGACDAPGFMDHVPADAQILVMGCEAHVCVLQTVLGLLDRGRETFVVCDAIGSRRAANRDAGIRRMERRGAEAVTTEMVVFEWMKTAEHPNFKQLVALIK